MPARWWGVAVAVLLAVARSGVPGAADVETRTIVLTGTVSPSCTLGAWLHSGDGVFDGDASVALVLDSDADLELDAFSFALSASGTCNFTHRLSFTPGASSNGLHRGVAETPPPGFTNHVNYRARLSGWIAFTIETTTNGTPTNINPQSGTTLGGIPPTSTTMTLTVDQPQVSGGPLLLAGTYTDTIEIRIGNF